MPNTSATYPSTVTGGSATADGSWSNVSNALTDNGSYASSPLLTIVSPTISFTNFLFSIVGTPSGIVAEIKRYANISSSSGGGGRIVDDAVILLNGTGTPESKAFTSTANRWPLLASVAYKTYPSSGTNDLWGLTFTSTQVNSSSFGLRLTCVGNRLDGTEQGFVDTVRITVYYTAAAATLFRLNRLRKGSRGFHRNIPMYTDGSGLLLPSLDMVTLSQTRAVSC